MHHQITEQEGEELPWGAVVCSEGHSRRALHVRSGYDDDLYWSEPGVEGPTYPWLFGDETVTVWYDPRKDS